MNDDIDVPMLGVEKLATKCSLKDIKGGIAMIEMAGKKSGDQNGIEY